MRSKMEADEQAVEKLIEIQEQMKAELESERLLAKNLFSALQVEEKEVIMTNLPMQSETETIVPEEKKELEKEHLMKQKYLTKQKKELTGKIPYAVLEQQGAESILTPETEKLKKHKGQERQTTERCFCFPSLEESVSAV